VQNSVAAGMDLASLAPKWIDVKRGALIMCIVGYVINPWRFVNSPSNFITVLNSFGMFISPLAGINVVDLQVKLPSSIMRILTLRSWLVRKRNWKVPDLYVGNSEGIYWYTAGLNWRAFFAWTMGVWPSFRKLFPETFGATTLTSNSWIRCRDWRRKVHKSCLPSSLPDSLVCGFLGIVTRLLPRYARLSTPWQPVCYRAFRK
jgi:NCS1 family nucleobase:cation symporter-1